MYTYEQRMEAVKLYIKYGKRAAAVIRTFGYPNRHMLVKWYQEFESTGDLLQQIILGSSVIGFILSDPVVGSLFIEAHSYAQLPLGFWK